MTLFFHRPYRQVPTSLLVTMCLGLYVTWVVLRETPSNHIIQTATVPSEVVQGWAKTFPHSPMLAASLTTEHFRDGRAHDV